MAVLPTLTHTLGTNTAITTGTDAESQASAALTAITAHADLTVINSGLDTSVQYVHFKHASGTHAAEYILAGDTTGSPDASQMVSGHTATTDVLVLGMAPEGGTFTAADLFTATGPFGVTPGDTGTLWGGYCNVVPGATDFDFLRVLANGEYFFIAFDGAVATDWSMCWGGVLIEAPTAADGHKALDQRVYSFGGQGNVVVAQTWGSAQADLLGHGSSGRERHIVFDPGSASSATPVTATRSLVAQNPSTVGQNTTHTGTRQHFPMTFGNSGATQYFGRGRQLRYGEPTTLNWAAKDGGGAILWSPSGGANASQLAFDQAG